MEALRPGVHVVKVQRNDAAPIPAQGAGTARLRDERPLDLLMAAGYGLSHAALAAPTSPTLSCAIETVLVATVLSAFADLHLALAVPRRRPPLALYPRSHFERMFAKTVDGKTAGAPLVRSADA